VIDWSNPESKISKYFTVREALYLPRWQRLANANDGLTNDIKEEIAAFAQLDMDQVREYIGTPIHVNCWYRPPAYNKIIGGAENSAHMSLGHYSACDWHADVEGIDDLVKACNVLKARLLAVLEEYGLRMENNENGNWIHLDNAQVKTNRFFKP